MATLSQTSPPWALMYQAVKETSVDLGIIIDDTVAATHPFAMPPEVEQDAFSLMTPLDVDAAPQPMQAVDTSGNGIRNHPVLRSLDEALQLLQTGGTDFLFRSDAQRAHEAVSYYLNLIASGKIDFNLILRNDVQFPAGWFPPNRFARESTIPSEENIVDTLDLFLRSHDLKNLIDEELIILFSLKSAIDCHIERDAPAMDPRLDALQANMRFFRLQELATEMKRRGLIKIPH